MRQRKEQNIKQDMHREKTQAEERSRRWDRREVRWDRLDNTANLFPVISTKDTTNVYRIAVNLSEEVQPEYLQKALDRVLPQFDTFNVRLRRGVFWLYFERNGKPSPRIYEENDYPCRYIAANKNNSYLFRVTYYGNRINLEVFHVLTDGMGAVNFLRELTYQYLRLAHSELSELVEDRLSSETSLNKDDSYLKNYRRKSRKMYKTERAFHMKGEHFGPMEMSVLHVYMKLPGLKEVCRKRGISINQYLVAAYIWSIFEEYHPKKKPIVVCVPVNLRPFFDSTTTKNFFTVVSAVFHPEKEEYDLDEIIAIVRESLSGQITKENLERLFSYNVSNQKKPYLRIVPLFLKNMVMKRVYRISADANTTTVTNLGTIDVKEEYRNYIRGFYVLLSASLGQDMKGAVCSYGDTLVWSFTSTLTDMGVQRNFVRILAAEGIEIEIESNGVQDEQM